MKKDKIVVGISGSGNTFHDNSVCVVKNGKILFAASEERYTRIKHDPSFPTNTLKAALKFTKLKKNGIDYYASGWPRLSLYKTFTKFALVDVLESATGFIKNAKIENYKCLIESLFANNVKNFKSNYLPDEKHIVIDHYLAHASSAYRTSGVDDCVAVVWDGFGTKSDGSLAAGGVFLCKKGDISQVETHPVQASLGLFYEAVTNALGFTPAEGEGKTMGLAVYGKPEKFYKRMRKLAPHFDGNKWVSGKYYFDMLSAVDLKYKKVFEASNFYKEIKLMIDESNKDVAAACQRIIEEEGEAFFKYLIKKYNKNKFVVSGGVFLNVKMAKKIREIKDVTFYYVHPHAGDGGLALGAALEVYSNKFNNIILPSMSPYLGDSFTDREIKKEIDKTKNVNYFVPKNLSKYIAEKIDQGVVVGFFEGREEWGPRALGARSVLADPRKNEIKERINNYLKKREWFMPFAASILEEKAGLLFKKIDKSPFMTMAYDTTAFGNKSVRAAIHVDGTGRPQTVSKFDNKLYWDVINEFDKLTGVPGVLNTSFNRHGLPIVHSPKDALDHLVWGAIDELAIGKYIVKRN